MEGKKLLTGAKTPTSRGPKKIIQSFPGIPIGKVHPEITPQNPNQNKDIHPPKTNILENLVYHYFRQLWLVFGVKLMEINSNWFSRMTKLEPSPSSIGNTFFEWWIFAFAYVSVSERYTTQKKRFPHKQGSLYYQPKQCTIICVKSLNHTFVLF